MREQKNNHRPYNWYDEAKNDGLLNGNGKCAKRLRQLAKQDRRKNKRSTEHREKVKRQLGKDVWKYGMIRLADTPKPRG